METGTSSPPTRSAGSLGLARPDDGKLGQDTASANVDTYYLQMIADSGGYYCRHVTIPIPPVAHSASGSTSGEKADMARRTRRGRRSRGSRRGGVVL